MTEQPHRGYHDIGGSDEGPVARTEHQLEPWEKRVDVLRSLLGDSKRRILRADGLRGAVESMGEDIYRSHTYYERWMAAIIDILVERGIFERSAIEAKIQQVADRVGVEVPPRPSRPLDASGPDGG